MIDLYPKTPTDTGIGIRLYSSPQAKVPAEAPKETKQTPTYTPFTGEGYFPAPGSTDVSGRPFQGFTMNIPKTAISPEVNVPLRDVTRTAAGFDPTKPMSAQIPKEVLGNPRMSHTMSTAIKNALHGDSTTELDHIMALGLGGSNALENLQIQPGIKGGEAATSDKLENDLINKVKNDEMTLRDAQSALITSKGKVLPEEAGQRSKIDQWLMDNPDVLNPLANLQSSAEDIGKNILGDIKSIPKDFISPFIDSIKGLGDAAVNAVTKLTSKGRTVSEQVSSVGDVISASANVIFSPISSLFSVAKDIPLVAPVSKMVALPFTIAGTAGEIAGRETIDALPISEKDKSNLRSTVGSLGSLAGMLALGYGIEKAAALIAMKDTAVKVADMKTGDEKVTPSKTESILKENLENAKPQLPKTAIDQFAEGIKKPETLKELQQATKGVSEAPKTNIDMFSEGLPKAESPISVPDVPLTEKGVELTSGLNPHFDKFLEENIKPAIKSTVEGTKKTFELMKEIFTPSKKSEEAIKTSSILRENLGRMARVRELLYSKLLESRKVFDRYTPEQATDFMDKIETGKPIEGANEFVGVIRDALDSRWKKVQEIKGTDAYIENYFPHIWKDPVKAAETLFKYYGKKPFEGTKSFLKQRKIPTIKEGIELGLEPVSYNPVDLVMAKVADMDKFLMAQDTISAFKKEGLMKFVRFGEKAPDGWAQINDKMGKVYQYSDEAKGMIQRGTYYMPRDATRIVNNYLSPGLQGNPIYNVVRKGGNFMTQMNLGFSFFHALFTTNDAVISKIALGTQKLSTLDVKGAFKDFAESPSYVFRNVIHGNKLLEDYFRDNPQMPQMVEALQRAGGRVKMDSFYQNNAVEGFMKALRSENYLGALVKTPGALVESVAKPVLQWLVPRQKMGVFMDMAKDILAISEKENWSQAKETLRLQEAWDSVDNRLGELVYDNLFWNKALKDLGMGSVRALGWNLGTIRELGGGLKEIGTVPYKLITGGEIRMTPRMAYTITLPIVVGLEGAVIMKLMTGNYPQKLIDYFYPKTGKQNADGSDERVALPSYMKDVFAVGSEGALKVASNKLNPLFSTMSDMFQNQDYYGTEIRNVNDPLVKQMQDEFTFLGKQFLPFSVQGAVKGQSNLAKYGSFVGLTPAPSYVVKTSLEKKIEGMYEKRFGQGTKTQEDTARQNFLSGIRKAYLSGDPATANTLIDEAKKKGYFANQATINTFIKDSDIPGSIRLFRRLPSPDQQNLLKQMTLSQLNEFAWYASKETKSSLSSLSEEATQFVDMVNNGQIQQPTWKAGKIIPSP